MNHCKLEHTEQCSLCDYICSPGHVMRAACKLDSLCSHFARDFLREAHAHYYM